MVFLYAGKPLPYLMQILKKTYLEVLVLHHYDRKINININIYIFMLQHCPEVPIRCHKNPVKEKISVPLQKTAAAVNELSGKNQPTGHND